MLYADPNAPDTQLLQDVIFTSLTTGLPLVITGDVVKVALVPVGGYPAAGDWVTCTWSSVANAVTVQFNQGAGSFQLAALVTAKGTNVFYPWVQVFDSPDQPIAYSSVPVQVRAAQ